MSNTFDRITNPDTIPWVTKFEMNVEKKITQNGEYTITPPNPGLECIGHAKLSVYVPSNTEPLYNTYLIKTGEGEEDQQIKKIDEVKENETVVTTENGTKTLTIFNEDENKITKKYTVITSVNTESSIQPVKTVTFTENGETLIEPDEGYDAINLITASVNVPTPDPILQEKTVTYTVNGTSIITPASGYDGLSKVTTTVNVPTPEPNLEEKEVDITEPGETEILPSEGYDGMSKVTVTTQSQPTVTKEVKITPTTTALELTIEETGKVMDKVNITFNDPIVPDEYISINSIKARFKSTTETDIFVTANTSYEIIRDTDYTTSWDYTTSSSMSVDVLGIGRWIPAVALNTNYKETQDRKWGKISLLLLNVPSKTNIEQKAYTLTFVPVSSISNYCDLPNTIYFMTKSDGSFPSNTDLTKCLGFYDTHSYDANYSGYIHPLDACGMVGKIWSGETYLDGSVNQIKIGEFRSSELYGTSKITVYEYARIYGNIIGV